jgi:hypothetical protein
MKTEYKILLIGIFVIVLFDALCSIASRRFNFNYSLLAAGSFIIYGIFGFIAANEKSLKTGVLIAAGVGLFDSTVGWEISMLLHANTGDLKNNPTPIQWVITAIFVTGLAALCGLIGGWLSKIFKKKIS